jgi:hypothetical protein
MPKVLIIVRSVVRLDLGPNPKHDSHPNVKVQVSYRGTQWPSDVIKYREPLLLDNQSVILLVTALLALLMY